LPTRRTRRSLEVGGGKTFIHRRVRSSSVRRRKGRFKNQTCLSISWIEPQLSKLAAKAPTGPDWVHQIKFDGYRIAARTEKGQVELLTRSGLDWTPKYPMTAAARST
jgi:ATP-dependent DNA ligase